MSKHLWPFWQFTNTFVRSHTDDRSRDLIPITNLPITLIHSMVQFLCVSKNKKSKADCINWKFMIIYLLLQCLCRIIRHTNTNIHTHRMPYTRWIDPKLLSTRSINYNAQTCYYLLTVSFLVLSQSWAQWQTLETELLQSVRVWNYLVDSIWLHFIIIIPSIQSASGFSLFSNIFSQPK